jgi:hypothetical protein
MGVNGDVIDVGVGEHEVFLLSWAVLGRS